MNFPVKYSISDLEQLSGINAATIRVWERRYKLINPKRTDTNIRYYDNEDLKYILNVSSLQRHGNKISHIALMSKDKVNHLVIDLERENDSIPNLLNQITKALIDIDTIAFRNIIHKSIKGLELKDALELVLVPVLEKIGILWQTSIINPAQEHFACNIIRDIIIHKTYELEQKTKINKAQNIILFLPDNELHEIGLLIYKYLVVNAGYPVVYLGQAVPLESLPRIIEAIDNPIFITSITNAIAGNDLSYTIQRMSKLLGERKLLLTGMAVHDKEQYLPDNIIKFGGFRDVIAILEKTINEQ